MNPPLRCAGITRYGRWAERGKRSGSRVEAVEVGTRKREREISAHKKKE
jgi:hypothetical protein